MKNMLYYIAESSKNEMFNTTLIARCETLDEAEEYIKKAVAGWREEGYRCHYVYDEDVRYNPELMETARIWGAEALDDEFCVKHDYLIFATPIFMGGGTIG